MTGLAGVRLTASQRKALRARLGFEPSLHAKSTPERDGIHREELKHGLPGACGPEAVPPSGAAD